MARTALTVLTPPANGQLPSTFAGQAADPTNFNNFPLTGREILIAQNSSTTAAATVTVHSVPDDEGRTDDIVSFSLAIGAFALFPQFPVAGWRQPSDGTLWVDASSASILFTVVRVEV
jgi:hypothetical protein